MILDIIAGARPNFIKIAAVIHAINERNKKGYIIKYRLIHTGQHYDKNMSENFFTQLNIPKPQINLNAGGGTQAEQTGAIMLGYEKLLSTTFVPNICIVVGDVTSTMACAIVAKKALCKVAHIEAGIRSNDLSMPEEINRLVTDSITDYFFTTTLTASNNLNVQGVAAKNIFFVGNTMIDTLMNFRNKLSKPKFWNELKLEKKKFLLLTIHRPNNVDDKMRIKQYLQVILDNSKDYKIVFPVHPRTKQIIHTLNIESNRLFFVEPQGYLQFNYLAQHAFAVITDSGGVTEETTYMGVPCLTLRDNTERPETITIGTNELIGTTPESLMPYLQKLFDGQWKKGAIPEKWDGKAGERIVSKLLEINKNEKYFSCL
ncbi:UDP-N-acetylglucosamine 2-epimerase (non-hydrolyzing) [Flavobacterium agricola]|uniref:UDP-N-acetylglucosamine 2-epimerase (Non-hydrolyzing) n=1 Tax=Flavobacterium agricola TaxID=2870839 RepID=A0ABY6LW04_9FLAO|nr:UDP-N-acetylglucosamine 2-epimerase (non-hydrolyzing) [Flavobacterium agricola]UYW00514.1 UDP-N-acetylglucosamine 2-epimerase (non-hydrolyzing) [Flavobacterium agricola]